MTRITDAHRSTGTHRTAGLALLARPLARLAGALLDADRRYREAVRFRDLPPERLDDIGLPPPAEAGITPPFQSPAW